MRLPLHPSAGEWSPWGLGLLLSFAICLAYSNTLHGAFQYDDHNDILDNPSIRHLWPLRGVFFIAGSGFVTRPVANLTFAINYAMGAFNPFYYHLTNLVIHIGASLAFIGVLRRTLELADLRSRFSGQIPTLSLVMAALWALHPLQTESVSYITQRYESLMGLFVLLTFYAVLRSSSSPAPRQWELLAILSCLLALGSKEVAVSVPLLVLLFDRTFITGTFSKAWHERKVLYVGLLLAWIAFAIVQLYAVKRTWAGLGEQSETVSWWLYALNQPAVILHYLRLAIWPHPLNVDYLWPVTRAVKQLLSSIFVIGSILGLTLWGLVRMPKMAFLSVFFFFILAPTSSVMPILDLAVEHRMYLPLAPTVIIIVLGLYCLINNGLNGRIINSTVMKIIAVVTTAGCFSALGILTYLRNEDYQHPIDLWRAAVLQAPNNPRAHHNYAFSLTKSGIYDEALRQYAIATQQSPNVAIFQSNYGALLGELGRYQEGMEHVRRAILLDPKESKFVVNLGSILWQKGSVDNAAICFEEAIKLNPRAAVPHACLASIALTKGKVGRAHELVQKAIKLEPHNPLPHYILGLVLLKKRDPQGAQASFQTAISLDRSPEKTASNAGWAYHENRMDKEAIVFLRRSQALRPDQVGNEIRLAWILATSPDETVRNGAEALAAAENLLRTQPFRSLRLLDLFASSLAEVGRFPEAREAIQEAIAQAKSHGGTGLPALQGRLALFEKGLPYREIPVEVLPPSLVDEKP